MQLQQQSSELQTLGIKVVVVTFQMGAVARNYVSQTNLPWPVLEDNGRQLYAAYGMDRGSAWGILGPASWGVYAKLLLRGRKLERPTDDVYQLGGDVLIDPQGIVRLHHVGKGPADRPTVDSIFEIVRKQNATGP